MKTNDLIIRPVLTEKASHLVKNNTYTFEVHADANKNQVATVLETLYKVKVGKVRMTTRSGKVKRVGKKMEPQKQSNKKIAYVSLVSGKIDVFPQS